VPVKNLDPHHVYSEQTKILPRPTRSQLKFNQHLSRIAEKHAYIHTCAHKYSTDKISTLWQVCMICQHQQEITLKY